MKTFERIKKTIFGSAGETPRVPNYGLSQPEFDKAVLTNMQTPYFETEIEYKFYQLETDLAQCREDIQNLERRVTQIERRN